MFKQITGSLGAVFASLCCLGVGPVLAALTAMGLGFIINDAILIPLLAIFLLIAVWGLKGSRTRHGVNGPFYLGSIGAVAAFVGILVFMPVHIIGLAIVIAAAVWDIVILRKGPPACESN